MHYILNKPVLTALYTTISLRTVHPIKASFGLINTNISRRVKCLEICITNKTTGGGVMTTVTPYLRMFLFSVANEIMVCL